MNQQPSFISVIITVFDDSSFGRQEREIVLENLLFSDKVRLIRLELAIRHQIPLQVQRSLKIGDLILYNEERLYEYSIVNNSRLTLITSSSLIINVKLFYETRMIIHSIDISSKIKELRTLIDSYFLISPTDQILGIDGQMIGNNDAIGDNELTLSTYGFTDYQLVTITSKLEKHFHFCCTVNIKSYLNPSQSITFEALRPATIEDLGYLMMKSQMSLQFSRKCFTYSGLYVSEETELYACSIDSTMDFDIIDLSLFDASLNKRRFLVQTLGYIVEMVTLNENDILDNIRLKFESKYYRNFPKATYYSLNNEELPKTATARDMNIPSVIVMNFQVEISIEFVNNNFFFKLRFDQMPTVREVKQMIESTRFFSINRQVLYFKRNELINENERIPESLTHTGHLVLIVKSIEKFKIYISILNDFINLGEFTGSDKVSTIKEKINFAPNGFQYLVNSIAQPSQLIDHLTIGEHGLLGKSEYTVYLVDRLDKRLDFELSSGVKGSCEVSSLDSLDWMRMKVIGNVPCKVYVGGQEIIRDLREVELSEYPNETLIYFLPFPSPSPNQILTPQVQSLNVPITTSTITSATSSSTLLESPSGNFQRLHIQSSLEPISPHSTATSIQQIHFKRPLESFSSQPHSTQPPFKVPYLRNQQGQSISIAGLSSSTQSSSLQRSPMQMLSGLSSNPPFQQQGPSTSTQSQDYLMSQLSLDQASTPQTASTSQVQDKRVNF